MSYSPPSIQPQRRKLHATITRELALKIIEAERHSQVIAFPNETELSSQLGVSRTVVRESMKVLVDKGMVEMRPRAGTKSRARAAWNLLDPDILSWQAELGPDARFLRDLCEVRLAIEPTAAGFAAVRASTAELDEIARSLMLREALPHDAVVQRVVELDVQFYQSMIAASHNPLLMGLTAAIREPFKTTLLHTFRTSTNIALSLKAQRDLFRALHKKDPVAASRAAERAVGVAMLAVEEKLQAEKRSAG
ncbi:MAG TPA: FCD domain-containing protein [Terriglobales bacterium]|nr:FCD domain-containing protein [Terriglobales bacterium]